MKAIICQAVAIVEDGHQDGSTPLLYLKHLPQTKRLIQRVNICLSQVAPERQARLRLIQALFDLPETPATSYELTLAQALVLAQLGNSAHPAHRRFVTALTDLKESLCPPTT